MSQSVFGSSKRYASVLQIHSHKYNFILDPEQLISSFIRCSILVTTMVGHQCHKGYFVRVMPCIVCTKSIFLRAWSIFLRAKLTFYALSQSLSVQLINTTVFLYIIIRAKSITLRARSTS